MILLVQLQQAAQGEARQQRRPENNPAHHANKMSTRNQITPQHNLTQQPFSIYSSVAEGEEDHLYQLYSIIIFSTLLANTDNENMKLWPKSKTAAELTSYMHSYLELQAQCIIYIGRIYRHAAACRTKKCCMAPHATIVWFIGHYLHGCTVLFHVLVAHKCLVNCFHTLWTIM